MLEIDPANASSRFRMLVRLPPMRPGIWAVSIPVTGKFPAPPAAVGNQLTELRTSDPFRASCTPPLKACWRWLQLRESVYENELSRPSVELQPPFSRPSVNEAGLTRSVYPATFGNQALSSSLTPSCKHGPLLSFRKKCKPARNSFTRLGESVDTSEAVTSRGRRNVRSCHPVGQSDGFAMARLFS